MNLERFIWRDQAARDDTTIATLKLPGGRGLRVPFQDRDHGSSTDRPAMIFFYAHRSRHGHPMVALPAEPQRPGCLWKGRRLNLGDLATERLEEGHQVRDLVKAALQQRGDIQGMAAWGCERNAAIVVRDDVGERGQ